MAPLIILLSVFIIGYALKRILRLNRINISMLGKIAMSIMLLFTGISHFIFAKGMINMIPDFVSLRLELLYATGFVEILGAICLLIEPYSKWVGILLIAFFICVLPANIYAAINFIDPVTGLADGHGPLYLFFRIPLQLFFVIWIYYSSIQTPHFFNKNL